MRIVGLCLLTFLACDPSQPQRTDVAVLENVRTAIERGDARGALTILNSQGPALDNNAMAHLLRGHAHRALVNEDDALDSYVRALSIDASLATDHRLRANLRGLSQSKDALVVTSAFDLWLRTNDPAAIDAVTQIATGKDSERRAAVEPVIQAHGVVIHDWQPEGIDLRRHECEQLARPFIRKLEACDFGDDFRVSHFCPGMPVDAMQRGLAMRCDELWDLVLLSEAQEELLRRLLERDRSRRNRAH